MSDREKKSKSKSKSKSVSENVDYSPPSMLGDSDMDGKQKRVGRPASNKNDIVKSRLTLIIDILSMDDADDERTLKKNVVIAVRHLKDVAEML